MRKVKAKIIRDLQNALRECNYSDLGHDSEYMNDLSARTSRQEHAYGHISEALRCIGGDEMVDYWIVNGEFE